MAKVIVNLTAKLAEQEIEKQLMNVPASVLHRIHAPSDLHRSLVMYVLKRLPNHYAVLDDQNITGTDYEELGATAENHSQIAALITEGIRCFLGNSYLVEETLISPTVSSCTPSTWFG